MKKKYNYLLFSPYFGKLPQNFNLWLNSCSYNKKFKFIVFTDDCCEYDIPENVSIIKISFSDFVNKIQKKFDFKISLNNPYKLCDFKPTYGYVFEEYLDDYEYWGYCDIDLIFGDLNKFLPNESYDKISFLGHFCLYKNSKYINELFMETPKNAISYIDILSNEQHFGFDEIGNYGINSIFKNNKIKIFNYEINVADVDCRRKKMAIIKYQNGKFIKENKNSIFIFNKGKIFSVSIENKKIQKNEYAYVHFQKRKIKNTVTNINEFIIKYDGIIDYYPINEKNINYLFPKTFFIDVRWIKFKFLAIKRRLKRTFAIRKILVNKGREK